MLLNLCSAKALATGRFFAVLSSQELQASGTVSKLSPTVPRGSNLRICCFAANLSLKVCLPHCLLAVRQCQTSQVQVLPWSWYTPQLNSGNTLQCSPSSLSSFLLLWRGATRCHGCGASRNPFFQHHTSVPPFRSSNPFLGFLNAVALKHDSPCLTLCRAAAAKQLREPSFCSGLLRLLALVESLKDSFFLLFF